MRLGFIGFGEVSFELSAGLKSEGLTEIIAFDPLKNDATYGVLVQERAGKAGVELLTAACDVVRAADVIIAAVPGSKALQAAMQATDALVNSKIYVDVSTSSPATKKKIAEIVESAGAAFVDGALMGALTLQQHKVPILVSGSGSDVLLDVMSPYHMVLNKVSNIPGDAIAIKLVRSIYMKGLATLAVETLEAAATLNVAPLVLASLSDTLDSENFEDMMNFLVTASAIHGERQAHEMTDVMRMLQELGVEAVMTEATARRLHMLADKKIKDKLQGKKPSRWEQVI